MEVPLYTSAPILNGVNRCLGWPWRRYTCIEYNVHKKMVENINASRKEVEKLSFDPGSCPVFLMHMPLYHICPCHYDMSIPSFSILLQGHLSRVCFHSTQMLTIVRMHIVLDCDTYLKSRMLHQHWNGPHFWPLQKSDFSSVRRHGPWNFSQCSVDFSHCMYWMRYALRYHYTHRFKSSVMWWSTATGSIGTEGHF